MATTLANLRKAMVWCAMLLYASCRVWGQKAAAGDLQSVTVPMKIANNRVFIPIKVTGPNGRSRVVTFWVDSGGGVLALSGPLAKELGLLPTGQSLDGMGDLPYAAVKPPRLSLDDIDLDLGATGAAANLNSPSSAVFPGIEAEGFLPARILKNYDVVFDYPSGSFTLAKGGSLQHQGVAVPISIQAQTGFAKIDVTIDSHIYGFMLDTGAAFTGMSKELFSQLEARHPSWPHSVGAVGPANMIGKKFDLDNELIALPEITLGGFQLRNTVMVSRPSGTYETYISAEMSAPIVGALAGNVLRQFRLEIDYPHETAYLSLSRNPPRTNMDCVGLVLQVKGDGAVVISGSARHLEVPEIPEVQADDRLLKVDDLTVTGLPLSAVLGVLSGTAGNQRRLTIQRGARTFVVVAPIRKHP